MQNFDVCMTYAYTTHTPTYATYTPSAYLSVFHIPLQKFSLDIVRILPDMECRFDFCYKSKGKGEKSVFFSDFKKFVGQKSYLTCIRFPNAYDMSGKTLSKIGPTKKMSDSTVIFLHIRPLLCS